MIFLLALCTGPRAGLSSRLMGMLQVVRVATRALTRNKGRSFLTVLGIIIGVGAVITMVAIGEGARARVQDTFQAMGMNLIMIRSGSSHFGGAHGGFGSMPTITWDDFRAIRELPTIRHAVVRPEVRTQLASEESNWSTDLGGITPEFFEIRVWPIRLGRNITQGDVEAGNKVIVLGQIVSNRLFGEGVDPVGRQVRAGNVPLTVIGVLAHKGQSPGGYDLDDNAYIPASVYRSKIQGGLKNFVDGAIFVSTNSPEDAPRTEAQINDLLRDRHHLQPGIDDDFQVRNMVELASAQDEGVRAMRTLLAGVAAISLLIAGIGIMNIMLVSVTERTREIGVRLAVGARGRDILVQFLVEALTLSVLGGLLGVLLGVAAAERMSAWFDWPLLLRLDSIVAALAVSGAVGILFGLYPAWRAAALDPIEALRFEM